MDILLGSLCLSDIPKELIKDVTLKDGTRKKYLSISVIERKEPSKFGHTHFVSCSPKREQQREGVNYIFGDLRRYQPSPVVSPPTAEEIADAPVISDNDNDLPF